MAIKREQNGNFVPYRNAEFIPAYVKQITVRCR